MVSRRSEPALHARVDSPVLLVVVHLRADTHSTSINWSLASCPEPDATDPQTRYSPQNGPTFARSSAVHREIVSNRLHCTISGLRPLAPWLGIKWQPDSTDRAQTAQAAQCRQRGNKWHTMASSTNQTAQRIGWRYQHKISNQPSDTHTYYGHLMSHVAVHETCIQMAKFILEILDSLQLSHTPLSQVIYGVDKSVLL